MPVSGLPESEKKKRRLSILSIGSEKKTRRLSILSLSSLDLPLRKSKKRKQEDELSIKSRESVRKKERKNALQHIVSLASVFSPGTKDNGSFKVPTSIKVPHTPKSSKTCSRRLNHTWTDMMGDVGCVMPFPLSNVDHQRQEAIFELYRGEIDILEDLNTINSMYINSIKKLNLLSEEELNQIFSGICDLEPIHKDLMLKLKELRQTNGMTTSVGESILQWVPSLRPYIKFCSNQVFSKALLDDKKSDPFFGDFLQRCLDTPCSRKLDLWSLLEGVRSQFMKYPLMLRSIRKYTPADHADAESLDDAVSLLECLITEADNKTGEAKCTFYKCKLAYLYDDQRHPLIDASKTLLLHGILKNNKGTKLHMFLFNLIAVVTRITTHGGHTMYQVYRDPLPLYDLVIDDLKDGAPKSGGSFKSAFYSSNTLKNAFRLSSQSLSQPLTLVANDEHSKRQWTSSITSAVKNVGGSASRPKHSQSTSALI